MTYITTPGLLHLSTVDIREWISSQRAALYLTGCFAASLVPTPRCAPSPVLTTKSHLQTLSNVPPV